MDLLLTGIYANSPESNLVDIKVAVAAVSTFTVSALLVWWHEVPGAFLLAAEGLLVIIGYPMVAGARMPFGTIAFVAATLGAPPLFSGVVLLWLRLFPRIRRIA